VVTLIYSVDPYFTNKYFLMDMKKGWQPLDVGPNQYIISSSNHPDLIPEVYKELK